MSDIVVCCDGTWADKDDKDSQVTNVERIWRLAGKGARVYVPGPSGLIGGAFGFGLWKPGVWRLTDEAYESLSIQWQPNDRIYIFGFSRGAAVARMVAHKIATEGLNGHMPYIEFLGLFDTVASFGLPGAYLNYFETKFANLSVSRRVYKVAHAVAIHEDRVAFEPTLVNKRKGVVKETWFAGCHGDIGCGNITMEWMLRQARKAGLNYTLATPYTLPPPINRASGLWRRKPRKIGVIRNGMWSPRGAVIHETAASFSPVQA